MKVSIYSIFILFAQLCECSDISSLSPLLLEAAEVVEVDLADRVDNTCSLSDSENCMLEGLVPRSSTKIFPGGDTSCLESKGSYSFVVYKGLSDHVHIHFQGGSACWDQTLYDAELCRRFAKPYVPTGAFDMSNPLNPYRNFTVIVVLYCSGDYFLGNKAVANFTESSGEKAIYSGIANAMSAINYVVAEQRKSNGYLAKTLNRVVISGTSAGAIGAAVYANTIIQALTAEHHIILLDSFFLPMNESYQSKFFHDWNFCNSSLVPPEYTSDCSTRQFSNVDLLEIAIDRNPKAVFAVIMSKKDNIAMTWFNTYAAYFGGKSLWASEYFSLMLPLLERLNRRPNFLVYLISSLNHLYLTKERFYTATEYGDDGATVRSSSGTTLGTPVYQWVSLFDDSPTRDIPSLCEGEDCDTLVPKSMFLGEAPSSQPSVSSQPSLSPTTKCPLGTHCLIASIEWTFE